MGSIGALAWLRARFWVEAGFSLMAAAIALLTLLNRTWIEAMTGEKGTTGVDAGDGSLERLVVVGFAAVALAAGLLARREWRSWRRDRRHPLPA